MPGLPLHTLTDVWLNTVSKFPHKIAVVMDGQRYTYRALDEDIARLAGRLIALGLMPGDRVAIAMPNCWEFYVAYWATLRVGAILAPVNYRLGTTEMSYVFNNIEPKVTFVHHEVWNSVSPTMPQSSHLIGVGIEGVEEFKDSLKTGESCAPVPVSTEDVAIIAHTSGTTGVPKGAMMRHTDLLFNIKNTVIPFSWRHEDINLLMVPLFHVVGLYSVVPSSVYLGATVVVAPRPDPREVVELMERERVTNFLSVPTFHYLVVTLPASGRTSW